MKTSTKASIYDAILFDFDGVLVDSEPIHYRCWTEILAEFDYPLHEKRVTRDLSGGTRQKLNLALALLADPTVLLLDEPYQGFDRGTYVNFWDHCDAWRLRGKAVVVVTHMLAELGRADRVVELPAHPARGT